MIDSSQKISNLLIIMAVALRLINSGTAEFSYALIALLACFGRKQAIQALLLSWFFTMMSPGIAPEAALSGTGRYIVLLFAAMSVFLRSGFLRTSAQISWLTLWPILIGVFIAIHSIAFSHFPDVSILKGLSWSVATTTLIAGWRSLSPEEKSALENQVFGSLLLIAILSIPLFVLPLGYLRNGSGFQGVLNHPQSFGPTMAILGAWAGATIISSKKPSWLSVSILGISLIFVISSEARTAGISMILGLFLAICITPVITKTSPRLLFLGVFSKRFQLISVACIIGALIAGPLLAERINSYLGKRTESANLIAIYDASRGTLVRRMIANIEEKPFSGIGFGIASNPHLMEIERDSVFGLPTGAAIEKGIMPLAILEELGIFGFLLIFIWIFTVIVRTTKGGGVKSVAVLLTLLLINMGESMLFSPGGMGLLMLILMTSAVTEKNEFKGNNDHA